MPPPAGMTAPFEPETALVTEALKRWPTLYVLVQTVWLEARLSCDPAGIVPTLAALPGEVRVTVLPLFVTDVAGAFVVVVGVRVVVFVVVVFAGAVVAAAGAVELAGTSVSAGCAALSRLAS